MTAHWLQGRPVADAIWQRVQASLPELDRQLGRPPCLALVGGDDPAAAAYARQIERQFARRGLSTRAQAAPSEPGALRRLLGQLRDDGGIDGVLLLTPLPGGLDARDLALTLDPRQDVDGLHPFNLGRLAERRPRLVPSTALGGLRVLQHYAVPLAGQRVVVVGRSPVVGLPLSLLLLDADATVTIAHSRSPDLAAVTRHADILCVAAGRRHLIGPEHVRPGAVVVDFGTHPRDDGGLDGDVQTEAVAEVAGAITPVPGGTGPTTVAVLAEQTLVAVHQRTSPTTDR